MKLTVNHYGPEYYEEHRDAGLDYLGHGGWQEQYADWMLSALELRPAWMLDVGCACGSILEGFRKAGADQCHGIDLSEHMIKLGRESFPGLHLHIMDAANMHLFDRDHFDFVHSAQVAEHWIPELRIPILREIRRVTADGGLFFCCMDTLDSMHRQGRDPRAEGEDPTHQTMLPLAFWVELAKACGWKSLPLVRLKQHPDSFFKRYDWDAMLLQAV